MINEPGGAEGVDLEAPAALPNSTSSSVTSVLTGLFPMYCRRSS